MVSFIENKNQTTQTYDVFGMWCASCAKALEKHVSKVEGVVDVRADFATAQLTVVSDSDFENTKLFKNVSEIGYSLLKSFSEKNDENLKVIQKKYLIRNSIVSFLSMWSVAFSIAFYSGGAYEYLWASAVFGFVGAIFGLAPILKMAWVSIKTYSITFDLLVATANILLLVVSFYNLLNRNQVVFFDSIVMTISVVSWSRYFDILARLELRSHALIEIVNAEMLVEVFISGEWKKNKLQSVKEGRLVRIFKDEQIPFDGLITSVNNTYVDNSNITGESNLVMLKAGDEVFAGAQLKSEVLEFKVTQTIGHRRIDRLFTESLNLTKNVRLIWLKNIIDNWSGYVLLLSLVLFLYKFIFKVHFMEALQASAILMLVTCPCSLIIIEPLTKLWLKKAASQNDISINPNKLNKLSKPIAYIFDKTGTLVQSYQAAPKFFNFSKFDLKQINFLIASACFQHTHPRTQKIIEEFDLVNLDTSGTRLFHAGFGVEWQLVDGTVVLVGSKKWLNNFIKTEIDFDLGIVRNNQLLACYQFEEIISCKTLELIKNIKRQGHKLVLLTGDTRKNTENLARLDLFDEIKSDQSPEDKEAYVESVRENYSVVFVGDGVNDILAQARADIGVVVTRAGSKLYSMGIGATAVIEDDDLTKLPVLIKLITSFYQRQQLAFIGGLVYNLILLALAIFSKIHPLAAVLAMTMSTSLISILCLGRRKG